jgi:hypothetical protein
MVRLGKDAALVVIAFGVSLLLLLTAVWPLGM